MKKQKQKNVTVKELVDLARSSKMPEMSPPDGAKKDMLTGKTSMDRREAAQNWFKTAKQVGVKDGFLNVPDVKISEQEVLGKEVLYKGKKKK